MHSFLRKLRRRLNFLDEKERDKVINTYRDKINEEIKKGKKEKDAVNSLGSLDKVVKKVCQEHNIDYDYCHRQNNFDKDVTNLSNVIAEFLRDIIRIVRKVKLSTSLESFLEVVIKVIVLVLLFVVAKLPFILLESLAGFINRFVFYPFNSTFDMAVNLILSLAYLVVCVIMTLKVFGTYQVKEKRQVKEEELEKVDKEYNWLDFIVRLVIYLVILIPLALLALVDLFILTVSAYLVARGIDMIGIPIMLAGIFGLLFALFAIIRDCLYRKRRSYLLAVMLSVLVFITGIFITINDFSKFQYPNNLDLSSIKITEEEKTIELNDVDSRIYVNNGDYEVLLDNNLIDGEIRVVVNYYDQYIDVNYYQEEKNNVNYLVFDYKLDDKITYSNITENVIKDLKKGYIFNYSNVKKIKVKVYANDRTKLNLEQK